ncbi:hypothetical protein [Hyphomicrobium sp. NDB2Meth4]|uniref:hypothetical protein n=1 Tax=Hyphomicrobium sp. NDB2Meth4 TaxID=1892846 RepID=UPI000AECFBAD|nr:hypothetical protein [Hyphomicrobium sp. NDB2Meth4]
MSMEPTGSKFAFEAPAEIYSSGSFRKGKGPMSYRRFTSSAEAIRFAVEELPQMLQRGTVMEVGDERFEFADIQALYDSTDYPLPRGEAD